MLKRFYIFLYSFASVPKQNMNHIIFKVTFTTIFINLFPVLLI